jgi:hypothetical protein
LSNIEHYPVAGIISAKEAAMADQAQIDELVAKMTQEREKLLSVLEEMSEERSSTPPKPGEWSQKQQMSHLCEMESAYRAWVERALEQDGANVDGVLGERPAIALEKANESPLGDHIAELRRQRQTTMELISRISPADFDRTATNQIFGTLTVMQWLRSYYRHDRMHYDQVRGEEPSYKPQYAGGSEPTSDGVKRVASPGSTSRGACQARRSSSGSTATWRCGRRNASR